MVKTKFLVKENDRDNKDSYPYVIESSEGKPVAFIPSHFRHPRAIARGLADAYNKSKLIISTEV